MCNGCYRIQHKIPLQKVADEAVTKFLLDVEREYDRKLGYESKVKSLREEVNKLNQEQSRLRVELLLLPLIGPKLVKLTQIAPFDLLVTLSCIVLILINILIFP